MTSIFRRVLSITGRMAASVWCATALAASGNDQATTTPLAWNEEFAYITGMQAFIYGYPIIAYSDLRHRVIAQGQGGPSVAINQYSHTRALADPTVQYGGSPNRETPYSLAFVDVSREPVVLSVPPNPARRYYSLELCDMYSDAIGYIGLRATGNVSGDYLLAGPGWQGRLPRGIHKVIRSWTPWVAIFGRTFTDGSEADLARMRSFQDGYKITPLGTDRGGKAAPASHAVLPAAARDDPLGAFKAT